MRQTSHIERTRAVIAPGHFPSPTAKPPVAHALRGLFTALECRAEQRCPMFQEQDEPLEATLADLIVALTEEADRLIQNRRQAHNFVAYILLNILSHSAPVSQTWH